MGNCNIVLAMRWLFTTYNVMSRNLTAKKWLVTNCNDQKCFVTVINCEITLLSVISCYKLWITISLPGRYDNQIKISFLLKETNIYISNVLIRYVFIIKYKGVIVYEQKKNILILTFSFNFLTENRLTTN